MNNVRGSRPTKSAKAMREAIKLYLSSDNWAVEWQWKHVWRTQFFYLLEYCDKIKLDFNNVKHVKQV